MSKSADEPRPVTRLSASAEVAPPPDTLLLTYGQAAYLLQVSASTVRRAVEEGQIRMVRIMGRTLISREALADFIRQADLAKLPTSETAARLAAEERVKAEQRSRVRIVADWNTGRDTFGIDEAPKLRPKKKPGGVVPVAQKPND